MTTPVTMKVEVDCASKTSVKKALAFFISPAFQKDPPKPLDPLVSIEERPEITVLARYSFYLFVSKALCYNWLVI